MDHPESFGTPARKAAQWNHEPLPYVRHIIAIASGKGGVGKSTTTVNLALALKEVGHQVGILDADIYGPSIPTMLGLQQQGQPAVEHSLMIPPVGLGIKAMSMGLIAGDTAAIWRGPMVTKALVQMLRFVRWGTAQQPLDFLLLDLPPGTGDTHISLVQQTPLAGAIIVTTPQEVATQDAAKCVSMFMKVKVPLLGIIENMSYFIDASGTRHALFGSGGGSRLAAMCNTTLLGEIPIDPAIGRCADLGEAYVSGSAQLCADDYRSIAATLQQTLPYPLQP